MPSSADLEHIFIGLEKADWKYFADKRIFVTGGTGFIGKWLLLALLEADRRVSLNCRIEVLTRSPQSFSLVMPQLACAKNVILRQGDVRSFLFPSSPFDIVIHAATDVVAQNTPIETFSTCVEGTRRILDFTKFSGAKDFLLTSSGAVYGRHPFMTGGVPEDYLGGPDPTLTKSAYGEGKRVSEWLTCAQAAETGLRVKIARIYAQVGPYLPLDKHFAIGNFINDVLIDREIIIRGDGAPVRSYLYVADTVIWLLAILVRGTPGRAWNVGGVEALSISEIAERVGKLLGSKKQIRVMMNADSNCLVEHYVPNVSRAKNELKLPPPIELMKLFCVLLNGLAKIIW
jgi:nucleoside-diphosphate-sugar epimerase